MKIKDGINLFTDDFYYDLFNGGDIKPKDILKFEEDVIRVENSIKTILEFKKSLTDSGALDFI